MNFDEVTQGGDTVLSSIVKIDIVGILRDKGLRQEDAVAIAKSVDDVVAFPCLLGTFKDHDNARCEHGLHYKDGNTAKTYVDAVMNTTQSEIAVSSRDPTTKLNVTGKIEHAFLHNRVRVALINSKHAIMTKDIAFDILFETAHRYKDAFIEYDEDDNALSASKQMLSKIIVD